ncbi:MAG: hypothetical protein H0T73_14380 [Ardenticatenales bacterium]|nr:hypothetical protein [Ardenticatenales bacterium]
MAASHAARLQDWLKRNHIKSGSATRWLFEVPDTLEAQTAILRLLNEMESRFDDVIEAQEGQLFLEWDAIREELSLLPHPDAPWNALLGQLQEAFATPAYPESQRRRAERIWQDFLFLQEEEVSPLQVPAGWIAALDYLLQNLYFSSKATQEEVGRRHNVSTSTVGLRFRALVETLGVHLFDHPARKRLLAQRAIAIEGGRMSEAEFNQRLLRGQLIRA